MITNRRSLITGLASLLCAPAIVRASSIMPVKAWLDEGRVLYVGIEELSRLSLSATFVTFAEFKEINATNVLNTYPSIAAALAVAKPSDTIVLRPGVYTS